MVSGTLFRNSAGRLGVSGPSSSASCLTTSVATMLARLDHPERGNDFGCVGHSRQYLVGGFERWQAHLQRHADVVVDAIADLDTVTRKVAHAAGDTV